MRPLRPEVKAINEIKEHGYATMSGIYNESEAPEEWSVLEVWLTLGRPVLYFDYEWRRGKYHFYLEGKKEEARENRKKTVGSLDVYNAEEFLRRVFPFFDLADEAAKASDSETKFYITDDPEKIAVIKKAVTNFTALVNWLQNNNSLPAYSLNREKGIYIFGDEYEAIKKLGEQGVKVTEDKRGMSHAEGFRFRIVY